MRLMNTLSISISLSLATLALCLAGCGISSLGGSGSGGSGSGGGGGGSACAKPNPAGCKATGCPSDKICIEQGCTPSSCDCDPATGDWICTDDCGGGVCVAPAPPPPPPGPGPTTPDETAAEALANFARCMNRDQFLNEQVNEVSFAQLLTQSAVTCDLCHNFAYTGFNGGGFVLDPDGNLTFDNLRHKPAVLNLVKPVFDSNGDFLELEESHRILLKGTELTPQGNAYCLTEAVSIALVQGGGDINENDPEYCHPRYTISAFLEDQLHQFVADTIARAKDHVCTDGI